MLRREGAEPQNASPGLVTEHAWLRGPLEPLRDQARSADEPAPALGSGGDGHGQRHPVPRGCTPAALHTTNLCFKVVRRERRHDFHLGARRCLSPDGAGPPWHSTLLCKPHGAPESQAINQGQQLNPISTGSAAVFPQWCPPPALQRGRALCGAQLQGGSGSPVFGPCL